VAAIGRASGLDEAAVVRAAMSLKEKNLVSVLEEVRRLARLTEEGRDCAERGLPERRLVMAALELGGKAAVEQAAVKAGISTDLIPIAVGWVRRKSLCSFSKSDGSILLEVISEPSETEDEELLKRLRRDVDTDVQDLPVYLRGRVEELRRRKLVAVVEKVNRVLELTVEGKQVLQRLPEEPEKEVTSLTPEMIVTGAWRRARFREYDVTAAPRPVYPGKKHPFVEFAEASRRILVAMGFEEADGPLVETEFWNFDVLFQAQEHPAREIHDSYVLKYPREGDIEDPKLVQRVRRTHEDGWITGSTGWRYRWDSRISRRLLLRTQTTAVSMRYLAAHKKPPIKMFCLSKVFRPDFLDAKHAMEFTQLDGIVGAPGITLRHLLGFLQAFADALKLGEVKFKPGYFPFTEPSVESYVKHPKLGWVEFVGSGMFRPEVLKPLGIDFPVIAWGMGFDRLAMIALGIDDIRYIHSKRLDWLRQKALG